MAIRSRQDEKGTGCVYSIDTHTPRSEIDRRLDNLKMQLEANQIDAALMVQRADLFYFSGTIQEAHLYVPVFGEPVLMVFRMVSIWSFAKAFSSI